MSFTENFNYLKKKKGLSKYQIAQDLDCSQSSVKNWETGDVVPRDRSRNKIAKYFGITLAELDGDELPVLPEQGIKEAPDPKTEGGDSKVSKAINFVRCASPDEINEIENFFAYLESKRKNNETKS